MNYKTVFLVTDNGLHIIHFAPIIPIVIGLGISLYHYKYDKDITHERTLKIIKGVLTTIISSIIFLLTFPDDFSSLKELKRIYNAGEYKVVEGVIEDFHPMPRSGHEMESFTVNNINFKYSDFVINHCFNNTASHGGPIKQNGQQVRLSYITIGFENRILKVELKY